MSETTNETKAALASGVIQLRDHFVVDAEGNVTMYAGCDLCYETAVNDIWEQQEIRKFYNAMEEGLCVCANCLPAYLLERDLTNGETT